MQAGCSKVFITSRKAKACEQACAALNKLPNRSPGAIAIPVPADSSKASEIDRLVAEVKKHTEHVDILLANAGAIWGASFDTHSDSAFAKVMDLNVKAVFNTIQRFAPLLEARATHADPSHVVVTGSVTGVGIGNVGDAFATYGYSASKAAVMHLARNLAVELGPRHILVNSIAPGLFPSKMTNELLEVSGGADSHGKQSPNGRLGHPEDVAGVVVFLCSRASNHVNGDTVVIDGGKLWADAKL